MQKKYAKKKR